MDTGEEMLEKALLEAAQNIIGYQSIHPQQCVMIKHVIQGRDVFLSLPTSSWKSLCYCCLPLVFARVRPQFTSHVVVAITMSFDCSNKGSSKSINNQQSGADAIFHIEELLADLVTFPLRDSNKHSNNISFVHENLATITRYSQPPHHVWPARLGWIYWLTNKKIMKSGLSAVMWSKLQSWKAGELAKTVFLLAPLPLHPPPPLKNMGWLTRLVTSLNKMVIIVHIAWKTLSVDRAFTLNKSNLCLAYYFLLIGG